MAHCDLRTKWMMYVSLDTNIQGDYVQTHGETHGLLIDATNIYLNRQTSLLQANLFSHCHPFL